MEKIGQQASGIELLHYDIADRFLKTPHGLFEKNAIFWAWNILAFIEEWIHPHRLSAVPFFAWNREALDKKKGAELEAIREWLYVRYGLLSHLPKRISKGEEWLIDNRQSLLLKIMAAALHGSETPAYLFVSGYLNVIGELFSQEQLEKLRLLWRGGNQSPTVKPPQLFAYLYALGLKLFALYFAKEPMWQLMVLALPIASYPLSQKIVLPSWFSFDYLLRLDRFL